MTDAPEPQHHLDELASAHLDGRTTPAEAARVAADPALLARVDALAAVRAAVAAPVSPPDPARRAMVISAALDAFDATAQAPAGVTSLATRRHARRRLQLLGAVAAVVLAVLAVPVLANLGGDGDDQQVAFEAADERAGLDSALESTTEPTGLATQDGAGAVAGAGTPDAPAPIVADLGELPDVEALTAAARSAVDDGRSTAEAYAADSAPPACSTPAPIPEGADRLLVAAAVVAGREVVAIAYQQDAARRLLVLDATDCTTIAVREL